VQDFAKEREEKMQEKDQAGEPKNEMKPDNRWSTTDGVTITLVVEPYKAQIFYYQEQDLHYLTVYVLADGVFVKDDIFGFLEWEGHPSRKEAIQAFHFYVAARREKSCS
jgi:hypothetical protein